MASTIKNINTFTDYGVEAQDIERRRKMAEMFQQQALQPIEQTTAGGYVTPISWTQGLAKALQGYAGMKGQEKATQEQRDLAGRAKMEAQDYFGGMPQAKTTDLNPVAMDDEGNAMPPALQTTQPTRQELMSYALKGSMSGNPLVQPVAGSMLAQYMKQDEPYTLAPGAVRMGPNNQPIATAPFRPPTPPVQKTAQPGDMRQRIMGDQLVEEEYKADGTWKEVGRGPRFARQVPQVIVGGGSKEKVPMGYRLTSDGNLEAIPGGPADAKAQKQAEQVDSGRGTVSSIVTQLRDSYDQLDKAGGITNPEAGGLSNLGAGVSSSAIGQAAGRLFGTQNQSLRNNIAQTRPLLLNAIKQATGMSAKQMDSNAELKMYLSAATDPTLDIKANRQALDMLDKLYGLSGHQPQSTGATGSFAPPMDAIDAEIARRRGGKR